MGDRIIGLYKESNVLERIFQKFINGNIFKKIMIKQNLYLDNFS